MAKRRHARWFVWAAGLVVLIGLSLIVYGLNRSSAPPHGTHPPKPSALDAKLASMTTEQKVAQLFMIGFDGTTNPTIDPVFVQNGFGGAILFGYNIQNANQVKALTGQLRDMSSVTRPLIATDEEGAPVIRISWEPVAGVGQQQIHDTATAFNTAKQRGTALRELGINQDLAPVVDVVTDPAAGMYDRAFISDSGRLGKAMIEGYAAAGIVGTVKHFPSYGDFTGDVEKGIPVKTFSPAEAASFKTALTSAPVLMVSPIVATNIDPDNPAPISAKDINYARGRLGFNRVIMTDDINMQSIATRYNPPTFGVRAFDAGVDMLLFAKNSTEAGQAYQTILARAKADPAVLRRVDASVRRILAAKGY